jgi:hypothetical protein
MHEMMDMLIRLWQSFHNICISKPYIVPPKVYTILLVIPHKAGEGNKTGTLLLVYSLPQW